MAAHVHDFVTQFIRSLNALKAILKKGQAFAEHRKIDFTVLSATRLSPDQFPLSRQVQIASDTAKGATARMAGIDAPTMEDTEQTYDQLVGRIDKTIAFLQSVKPAQLEGYESRKMSFPRKPGVYLEGRAFLLQAALPNFFFHVTTAYAILRAAGVELGKADYLGEQDWKQG